MSFRRTCIAPLAAALAVACGGPHSTGTGAPKRLDYVALGDSVAAAPGVPTPAQPLGCRKSTNNYPAVLARHLAATAFTDVTCSGATTEDIVDRAQRTLTGMVDPQISALQPTATLITVTVGANDVGLAADAERCEVKTQNPPPCTEGLVAGDVDHVSDSITAAVPVWSRLIDQLRVMAPYARIVMVGYGTMVRPGGCFPGQPVLPADSDYLQAKLDELDDRQRQLAAEKKIDYFDTRPMSQGHDICAAPADRYTEGFGAKDPAVPLHPTVFGAAAVGDALARFIGRPGTRA